MWCHWHAFHLYNKRASPRFSRGQPTMVGSCDFQMILLNPLPTVDPLQPWHGKVKQLTQGHRVEQVQNSHTSTPKAGPTCSRNSSCTWLIHLPLNPWFMWVSALDREVSSFAFDVLLLNRCAILTKFCSLSLRFYICKMGWWSYLTGLLWGLHESTCPSSVLAHNR